MNKKPLKYSNLNYPVMLHKNVLSILIVIVLYYIEHWIKFNFFLFEEKIYNCVSIRCV